SFDPVRCASCQSATSFMVARIAAGGDSAVLVLAVTADVAPGGWAASNATALETHKTRASVLTVLRCPQGNDQATQASEMFVATHRKRKTGSRSRRTSSSTAPLCCGRLFRMDELVLGLRRLLQAVGVRRGRCSNS